MVNTIRLARAFAMKMIKPKESYFFATKSLKPLSRKFGFDRGTPIDRYWIEDFLGKNSKDIKGKCLEIESNYYTAKFALSKVTQSDILDCNKRNRAVIHGNLKNLTNVIGDNTYDCIILTQVLGSIDEPKEAIGECFRILKKNGVLLLTSAAFSPTYDQKNSFWRFTTASINYLLKKSFKKIFVTSYGNVLTGQYFWAGVAQEELTKKELDYNDPNFPCLVAARACKGAE